MSRDGAVDRRAQRLEERSGLDGLVCHLTGHALGPDDHDRGVGRRLAHRQNRHSAHVRVEHYGVGLDALEDAAKLSEVRGLSDDPYAGSKEGKLNRTWVRLGRLSQDHAHHPVLDGSPPKLGLGSSPR